MPVSAQTYRAFISYSHADRKAASRLFRQLGSYRLPKTATPSQQRRLGRFFMDREALVAAHDLSQEILTALEHSETLIVVCSPEAVASKWVTKEIEAFRQLRPGGVILTAIVAGDPVARSGEDACFPPILLEGAEPLAADLRKAGDGPKLGFMKLAAALSGAPLEALTRREAIRRNRRVTFITVTASLIALVMSGLALTAISARKDAEARRAEAEDMVDFMLGDLRDRLEPVGRLDVLDGVATKVLDYYEGHDEATLRCEAVIRKAHALHLATEVSINAGRYQEADRLSKSALNISNASSDLCKEEHDSVYYFGQSHYWAGLAALANDDPNRAEGHLTNYLIVSRQLLENEPGNEKFQREYADALSSLAAQQYEIKKWGEALRGFEQALEQYHHLLASTPEDASLIQEIANTLAWTASIHLEAQDFTHVAVIRREQITYLVFALEMVPENTWGLKAQLVVANNQLARALFLDGDYAAALSAIQKAHAESLRLYNHDPANRSWWRQHVYSLVVSSLVHTALGNEQEAQDMRLRAEALIIIGNEDRGMTPRELFNLARDRWVLVETEATIIKPGP